MSSMPSDKIKVDFVISNLGGDGAQRVVCTLANYLCEKNYSVRIITFRNGDKYPLNDKIERIRLHDKLIAFDGNLTRAAWHLFGFYRRKQNRPDVISSHIHTMGLITIPVSLYFGIKLVVSEHSNHLANKVSIKKWMLWHILYKFPDAVTILTSFDKAYFDKKNKNVVIVPNPLSFEPIRNSMLRNNKTIIAAGNLNRYLIKGFDNLIEMAPKIIEKHKDWKFMIIGEGSDGLSFLKAKVERLGIVDHVVFAGYRKDIRELLQISEIFILTSRYEGLPMVLMEAASQGIACIAYDCISGPSDIIEDKVSGVLVADQDKDEMTRKVISLIENPEQRKELGKNAVLASENFSLEKIGTLWQELFQKIL